MVEHNVFGLSHVELPVRDLARAAAIYRDVLGFPEKQRGEGFLDLESAGTVVVRLLVTPRPEHRATIRIHSSTIDATKRALVAAGCTCDYDTYRSPAQELVATLRDPDGHTLHVWRPLTEDEWDHVPELPKVLTWTPEADALMKSLLTRVPVLFRALARHRTTKVAEELAGRTKLVGREEVIRGFILASPRVTRGRNRQPLIDHGIDVDRYEADWAAD